jgi:hypothetical protein
MLAKFSRLMLPPVILAAALLVYRVVWTLAAPPAAEISFPRREPWPVTADSRELRICSDQQLAQVLDRVKPPLDGLTTNHLVHALRLWGPAADFGDPAIPSGPMMRNYLLDDRVFQQLALGQSPPLFYRGPDGVDVRSYDDQADFQHTSSYHTDDLLATLAESGLALDTPLHLRDGEARIADLLTSAMRRFYSGRHEYEWTIIACARYAHPLAPWRNKYGEKIDVEMLVKELTDKPAELGPCGGLHRLEALAVMYRIDQQSPALPSHVRQRILGYMKQASDRLVKSQSIDGYWCSGWSQNQSKVQSPKSEVAEPTLHDKLLVTGHHLEWLALAPEEVQPPRETIVRAGQWLTRTLLEIDEKTLLAAYGPYSHAARALCLWKGIEPMEAWRGQKPEIAGRQTTVRNPGSTVSMTRNAD